MNKKAQKMGGGTVVVLLLVGVLLLESAGTIDLLSGIGPGSDGVSDEDKQNELTFTEDVTASFYARDMFKAGNAVAGQGIRLFLENGDVTDKGTIKSGNSETLAPGDKVIIYFAENSTDYYTAKQTATIKDKGTASFTGKICKQDTAPTFTAFDENGDTNTAQAIGAGESVNVEFKLKATADSCYSNPEINVQPMSCITYNNTLYDKIEVTDSNGNKRSGVSPTQSISSSFNTNENVTDCWTFPAIKDVGIYRASVQVTSDGTNNPGAEADLAVTLDDADYDLDADDLTEIVGYEDESNNNLGQGANRVGAIPFS